MPSSETGDVQAGLLGSTYSQALTAECYTMVGLIAGLVLIPSAQLCVFNVRADE